LRTCHVVTALFNALFVRLCVSYRFCILIAETRLSPYNLVALALISAQKKFPMPVRQFRRKLKKRWRAVSPWIKRNTIALTVTLVHMWLFTGVLGERAEPMAADLWFAARGQLKAPDGVIIVSMDEESYKHVGLSTIEPWPREKHVELLNKLARYQPRLVVFDVLFSSPGKDPAVDLQLAQAFAKVPTVLSGYETTLPHTDLHGERDYLEQNNGPLELFARSAHGILLANTPIDNGVVRRFNTVRGAVHDKPQLSEFLFPDNWREKILPGRRDFINYYGPAGSIRSISYHQVLEEQDSALFELFKDQIVYVGAQLQVAAGIARKDSDLTPFGGNPTFGVEICATTAANLLHGDWIRRFPMAIELLVLDILAFVLTLFFLLLRPFGGAMLLLSTLLVWCVVSYQAFLSHYFVPGVILVAIILPVVFTLSTLYFYLVLQRSYRNMETALGVKLHIDQ
jgi:CHASE2 domain-containing sensor protein